MLKTTFCKNCGKFYDESLPECPVCARRRADAQAQNAPVPQKQAKKKKMTMADRMRAAVPAADRDDATIQLSTDEIAAATEAAKLQAAASAPVVEDLPVYEEEEPSSGGTGKKLLGIILAAVLGLILLVFCVGLISGRTPKPQKPSNQAVSSETDKTKNDNEQKPDAEPVKPDTQPDSQPEPEPQPETPVEPEQPSEPEPEPQPEPEPEPEPQPEPEPEPEPEPQPEPEQPVETPEDGENTDSEAAPVAELEELNA